MLWNINKHQDFLILLYPKETYIYQGLLFYSSGELEFIRLQKQMENNKEFESVKRI